MIPDRSPPRGDVSFAWLADSSEGSSGGDLIKVPLFETEPNRYPTSAFGRARCGD